MQEQGKSCCVQWESFQGFTSLGFRATERMTDIASTYSRPDRERCTSLWGKNSIQETELFLHRMISENCLLHLLATHEKRISWAPVGYNGDLTVL